MTDADHRPQQCPVADPGERAWAVLIASDRYEAELLVHHESLAVTGLPPGVRPAPGDLAAILVDGEPPVAVALGRIERSVRQEQDADDPASLDGQVALAVTYTRRFFDGPVPAAGLSLDGPVTPIPADRWRELADRVGQPPQRRSWLVSLDLPIEAATPAEAVGLFWSYVRDLGPRELPAHVRPISDELAMQAFVMGVEANQDPEEDD